MRDPKNYNQLEHRRALKLAREYTEKGYSVILHPTEDDLPPALAKVPIDLIARGQDKTIAIEVRTKENLTLNGSEDLRRMTDLVQQQPGWEFELVVTNPRRRAS